MRSVRINSLRDKATSGVIWSAFERFGQQGCAFFVQLILARLLAPEEFGLIAMVVVFISISTVLIDAGFSRALVQRKEVTDSDLSTVFYFNLIVSFGVAGLLYLSAPFIASFYGLSDLSQILRFLSFGLILSAFGAVHRSILTRNLLFKKLFGVSLPSVIISGAVGITMAVYGFGVWSLVAQSLSMAFLGSFFLWFQMDWRPTWVFDVRCLKEMFPYGARLAVSGILDQGFRNIYVLIIGKVFSPVDVGYFQRARAFQQLPVANFQSVLSRVAFPLLSKIQGDPLRVKNAVRKSLLVGALFAFTVMAGLSAVAQPMVVLLIGEKWLPAVPMLQVLCIAGALFPLHSINTNLLMATGRSDWFLRLEVLKKLLVVVNVLITYRYGVQCMIWGIVITSVISLILNTYYTRRLIGYTLMMQLNDVMPLAIMATLMHLLVCVAIGLVPGMFAQLMLGTLLGVVFVVVALRFLGQEIRKEVVSLLDAIPFGKRIKKMLVL
jgi:teichuronic acid exporter